VSLSTFILSDMERVLAEWDEFAGRIPSTRKLDREAPEAKARFAHNQALAQELRVRVAEAALGGPEKHRERHVSRSKLLPRERVERLLDPGSPFLEIGQLAANGMYEGDVNGASMIAGIGRVSGRQVMIVCNDATVKGGTYYPMTVKKHLRAQEIAAETHGRHRHEAGFDLNQMVSEYRALRATVLRLWEQTLDWDRAAGLQELIRFNEGIDQAMAESVARFMQDLGRARELMLAVLAHDVRSPLGAIVQSGNALLHDADLDPKHAQAARIVVSSGTRISGMVTTLLDVARARFGGLLPITCAAIDVADVCRRVAGEVEAAHPGRHVLVDTSGDTEGFWDAERLEQLLSNLLENAVSYGDPVRPITVKADGTRPHVRLCVQNHGPPIPADRLERIFDPLTRVEPAASSRRSGSLGLGLFIVREIARAHGGSISVTSDAERGTEFETYLPRRSEST